MTNPLSPATQSVLDAFNGYHEMVNRRIKIAAALRAAANLLNQAYANEEYVDSADEFLCDIATELEETK